MRRSVVLDANPMGLASELPQSKLKFDDLLQCFLFSMLFDKNYARWGSEVKFSHMYQGSIGVSGSEIK